MPRSLPLLLPPFSFHLFFLVLLQAPLSPEAFASGPRDSGLQMRGCTTLSVGHGINLIHHEEPRPAVEARLLDVSTHQPVTCYTPGASHLVQLRVIGGTHHKFTGLAISSKKACGRLGLEIDVLGKFYPESPLRKWMSCPNTVTQSRKLGGNNGVDEVSVLWQAPSMSSQSVTFAYSVVFAFDKWLEGLQCTFPSCAPPCVVVTQDDDNNSSAAASNHGNSTNDEGLQHTPDECKPSFASEGLVRCGVLQSMPKKCSVALGSVMSSQTPIRTRKFTRHHHPSSTLQCARTDCNC